MAEIADNIGIRQHRIHPNSLANLEKGKFKKGENHNPKGRPPKDVSLTSLLKEQIDTIPPGEKQGRTWRQLLVLAWLTGSMKNPTLLKELLDRLEGKIKESVDITTKGEAIGNGHKSIPTSVLDEAMEILYKSGCDTQAAGDNGTPPK